MKKYYLNRLGIGMLAGLLLPSVMTSQITFETIYPAIVHESGKDVVQTSDGGYVIAASTETATVNDLDVMVMKTNSTGDIVWKKTYGTTLPSAPNSILQLSDGNFFIVGYMVAPGSLDFDNYLIKIDGATGDSIFSKVYGGYGNEDAKEIIATSDGNYVIVGASNSISTSDYQMQLIKIDGAGNVLWTQYYGGPGYESARSVKQCSDGGFIVAGKTVAAGIASIRLVRTNSVGGELWTQTINGGASSLEGKTVLANSDGTFTLCVDDSTVAADSDVRIMNISSTGSTVNWNKQYGGTEKDICKMIKPTNDGGYVVTAMSRSFGWVNPDYWLLKLNAMGDTLWSRHFGTADHEHLYAVKQTSDNGYIMVGHTRGNHPGRVEEILFIKLNVNGAFGPVEVNEYVANMSDLSVYPNPSNGVVNLDLSGVKGSGTLCRIVNTMGQLVYSEIVDPSLQTRVVDLKENAPGIYYVILGSDENYITKKIILN